MLHKVQRQDENQLRESLSPGHWPIKDRHSVLVAPAAHLSPGRALLLVQPRCGRADRCHLEPGGPWITVDGNSEVSTAGSDRHPCNTDGCLEGQLAIRFQSKSGLTEVVPGGSDGTYTAPEEGVFTYGINDDSPENNKWYNSIGLIEHADIRIEPVQ